MQVVIWLVFCFLVSLLARNRRPGPVVVFIIAMFLSPLIGLAVALFAKKKPTPPDVPVIDEGETDLPPSQEELIATVANEEPVSDDKTNEKSATEVYDINPNIVYCDSCGNPLDADSSFCSNCGKSVE